LILILLLIVVAFGKDLEAPNNQPVHYTTSDYMFV